MSKGGVRRVAIIDYQAGNLRSCVKAFERMADRNTEVFVATNGAMLDQADAIVLPGQGAFGDCLNSLKAADGLWDSLHQQVRERKRPFFGICVGMQLLADQGQEFGLHDGLGWIGGTVSAIRPADPSLKIPHMGWNDLQFTNGAFRHPVLAGVSEGDHAYFVHSFEFKVTGPEDCLACSEYGNPVTAIVGRDNMIGTQFHPEKSQGLGLKMIDNFLRWCP